VQQLEPPNLNAPLYRCDWSTLWFALASAACAWLWHRPTALSLVLTSVALGGPVFFFALGPALHRVRYHRSLLIRALFLIIAVGAVIVVMDHIVPAVHAYVSSNA